MSKGKKMWQLIFLSRMQSNDDQVAHEEGSCLVGVNLRKESDSMINKKIRKPESYGQTGRIGIIRGWTRREGDDKSIQEREEKAMDNSITRKGEYLERVKKEWRSTKEKWKEKKICENDNEDYEM